MKFNKKAFNSNFEEYRRTRPDLSDGEIVFMVMEHMYPKAAKRFMGTALDPVYSDTCITAFMKNCCKYVECCKED